MPSGGSTRALERRGYAVAVISSTERALAAKKTAASGRRGTGQCAVRRPAFRRFRNTAGHRRPPPATVEPTPQAAAIPLASVASAQPVDDWHAILAALKVSGMTRELGQHCELRHLEETRIVLRLSPTHRHLLIKPAQDKLQQSLAEHFGKALQLAIEIDEISGAA
ncbi:MAG: DNA polymerase III subunit gamma/tau C-terminal domain-containing protein [Candidatus Accumulibacter phosphatis]|jgi:hypothetical protein|uniref:DNA polymerase III subunit gamma/tau C-terminal domain-containing protein n=1 Tax=Candidatus Accumulibacter contiguus TaxID=2954381 RepID=UPI002FC3A6DD